MSWTLMYCAMFIISKKNTKITNINTKLTKGEFSLFREY